MKSIPELYGSLVFSDKVMKDKLPKDIYKALRKTIENGTHFELDVANAVAVAMKGRGKRRHPLYALVPAHDRHYRRKA